MTTTLTLAIRSGIIKRHDPALLPWSEQDHFYHNNKPYRTQLDRVKAHKQAAISPKDGAWHCYTIPRQFHDR